MDFKGSINLYRTCIANPCCFWVIVATLASDNPLDFRKNLSEKVSKPVMTIDDNIRDEKMQHDFNKEAAKSSAVSSSKIDKYEYPTGEKILPLIKVEWYSKISL